MSNYDPEDELEEIVQKYEGHLPEIPERLLQHGALFQFLLMLVYYSLLPLIHLRQKALT